MEHDEAKNLLHKLESYTLILGRLYCRGEDEVLHLCANLEEYEDILSNAHVSIGGIHVCVARTQQRVLQNGFWWPNLASCINSYIKK